MPKKFDPNLRVVPHEYLACRTWGHAWDYTYLDKIKGEGYKQGMKCLRCPVVKEVLIQQDTGFRRTLGMKYPEQLDHEATPYLMPKGSGGALTQEERGMAALGFVEARYKATVDEVAKQRNRRRG